MNVQGQQFRVQGASLHRQCYGRAGCLSNSSSMDVQRVFHRQQYGRALCTCLSTISSMAVHHRTVFVQRRKAGLSGIRSVRFRNEKECRCLNQSDTGIRGPSPVPECSATGTLRYRAEMSDARMPMPS
jgi:hypothetical protein